MKYILLIILIFTLITVSMAVGQTVYDGNGQPLDSTGINHLDSVFAHLHDSMIKHLERERPLTLEQLLSYFSEWKDSCYADSMKDGYYSTPNDCLTCAVAVWHGRWIHKNPNDLVGFFEFLKRRK